MQKELIVSVFGNSRPNENDEEYAEARALGRALAEKGFAVCTGAYAGVMEAASRGAKDAGGKTYGVTTDAFPKSKANEWVDVEVRVNSWQERLFELIRLGDGFVACKGGAGTLAELAVVWEMMNKSVMPAKPLVVIGNFWKPVLECVRQVEARSGNSRANVNEQLIREVNTPAEAVGYLAGNLAKEM
ncbi:MAG: LOG family protein [Acidobacteriota bacterium]|nr:LOG family protein [Acidobacteriota bacterium]